MTAPIVKGSCSTVTPSNSCFTGSAGSLAVTVTPALGATGSLSGPATVCFGQAGVAYSTPTVSGATTYTWTVYMWDNAFQVGDWNQGFAAAVGLIGTAAMLVVVLWLFYLFRSRD